MQDDVGQDRIRYFVYINGRWRWRPTKTMRECGFHLINMGPGGPELDADGNPAASIDDKKTAMELNASWDRVRTGFEPVDRLQLAIYPPGSVGHGYQRALLLRKAERLTKGIVWTKEQESRDDWPRAWKHLEPKFGDCDPKTIMPEHFMMVDKKGRVRGLVPEIEAAVSVTERHRTIKVWRALWVKMKAMGGYCGEATDPSLAFANSAPDPRQAVWQRREVLHRVQVAWRHQYYGLAACMAVAWDTMLSPIDARKLTPGQCSRDGGGALFFLDRAKTGRAAAGTLSPWSQAILLAYVQRLGVDLMDDAPIFRNRSGTAYTKDTLGDDFRAIRKLIDPKDTRQLADMRRSGAVEGDAGGGSEADQSNKMANSIDTNKRLRKTYNPVNVASVRRFDEARAAGAKILEQKPDESVTGAGLVTLLQNTSRRGAPKTAVKQRG